MSGSGAHARGVADRLAALAYAVTGAQLPIGLRAWDGSEAGSAAGPLLVLRDRAVFRRLLWHPNELGLAQAYVAGELDIDGDLTEGLRLMWHQVHQARRSGRGIGPRSALKAAALAVQIGAVGRRPAAPLAPANPSGTVHSRERDRAVVSYHYDLSNEFYRFLLDPRWPTPARTGRLTNRATAWPTRNTTSSRSSAGS